MRELVESQFLRAALSLLLTAGELTPAPIPHSWEHPTVIAASLYGFVRADVDSQPIVDVEVSIPQLTLAVITSADGSYRFRNIRAGSHEVVVRRLGYREAKETVTVREGEELQMDFALTRVVLLDTVAVKAASREALLRDFEDNRRVGLGRFWTRADLEKLEGRTMASVLSQVAGIRLEYTRFGKIFVASSRGPTSINRGTAPCYAHVYLDNTLVYDGRAEQPPFDIRMISPDRIEAMEYYASPSRAPLKYAKLDANCGVLVIWSRRTP